MFTTEDIQAIFTHYGVAVTLEDASALADIANFEYIDGEE